MFFFCEVEDKLWPCSKEEKDAKHVDHFNDESGDKGGPEMD